MNAYEASARARKAFELSEVIIGRINAGNASLADFRALDAQGREAVAGLASRLSRTTWNPPSDETWVAACDLAGTRLARLDEPADVFAGLPGWSR